MEFIGHRYCSSKTRWQLAKFIPAKTFFVVLPIFPSRTTWTARKEIENITAKYEPYIGSQGEGFNYLSSVLYAQMVFRATWEDFGNTTKNGHSQDENRVKSSKGHPHAVLKVPWKMFIWGIHSSSFSLSKRQIKQVIRSNTSFWWVKCSYEMSVE